MLSRSQTSQQLVYVLRSTGAFGSLAVIEGSLSVEDYLTSGLTFPIAVVQTPDTPGDPDSPGRAGPCTYRISVCGAASTEAKTHSQNVASGGSQSSQHATEAAVQAALKYLNASSPGTFAASQHGLQGRIEKISLERLVVTPGKEYVCVDLDLVVYDETFYDYYAPAFGFRATPGGGHTVALSWGTLLRFDQYQYVLRRGANPGDAAPATTSGGAGVTITGGVLGQSATDTLGGSWLTYNYSLFRLYTYAAPGDQTSLRATAVAVTT